MIHADAAQLEEITQNLNLSHWSKKDYEEELERQDSFIRVGKIDERVVGFIVARLIINCYDSSNLSVGKKPNKQEKFNVDIEIYNFAVVEQLQRKGVGQKLLNSLQDVAAASYKSVGVWLEVRESNRKAIIFYTTSGFRECYRRKNFYKNPPENALVMKLEIN